MRALSYRNGLFADGVESRNVQIRRYEPFFRDFFLERLAVSGDVVAVSRVPRVEFGSCGELNLERKFGYLSRNVAYRSGELAYERREVGEKVVLPVQSDFEIAGRERVLGDDGDLSGELFSEFGVARVERERDGNLAGEKSEHGRGLVLGTFLGFFVGFLPARRGGISFLVLVLAAGERTGGRGSRFDGARRDARGGS